MKMRRIRMALQLLTAALAFSSCIKEKLEETYNKQAEQIDKYVSSEKEKNEAYSVAYNEGSVRLTKVAGEGPALAENGSVSLYYAGYTFSGSLSSSNMFGTNHQETAEGASWNLTEPEYSLLEIDMNDEGLLKGVWNGLIGVQAGEECEILFSGKYAFGNSRFGIIPARSALAFKIWVVGVSND